MTLFIKINFLLFNQIIILINMYMKLIEENKKETNIVQSYTYYKY